MPRRFIDRSFLIRALIPAFLLLSPVIFFHAAFLGDVILAPGDGWSQNFGVRVLIGQMIANGEWPLWNPYIFAGTPLLASIYPGAIYPLNWLFAVFSPVVAMNLVVVMTYQIALIGTYLFARRIGNTRAASLIAAIAFAFGGYMVSHMGHTSRIAAASWLPWILLSIEELYLTARWRWVVFGSFFLALQLYAGEPQMNCYTLILAGLYWLFSLIGREGVGSTRSRFVVASVAMAFCGLLLSLVQYLPSRELLKLGERDAIPFDYFAGGSFHPFQVFTFIFPYFVGGGLHYPFLMPHWGPESLVETCGYVGLLTVLLGFIALWTPSSRRMVAFWAGAAVLSLVLAFGVHLPFEIDRLLHQVPVYNLFRVQARHMFDFTFCAGILAAFGLTCFAKSESRVRKRLLIRGGGLFVVAVVATVIAYTRFGDSFVTHVPRPVETGNLMDNESLIPICLAIVTLFLICVFAYRARTWSAALLVLLLFVDLKIVANTYEWRGATRSQTVDRLAQPLVDVIKARESDLHAFRMASIPSDALEGTYDELNFPNVSIARGVETISGYDALRLNRFARVAGDMSIDGVMQNRNVLGSDHKGLDLLNVKYLLMARERPIDVTTGLKIDGVRFRDALLSSTLSPQSTHVEFQQSGVRSSGLVLVTTMSNSGYLPDGQPVLRVTLHGKDGDVVTREFLAGRDTSEWAFDRPDVRASIKHQRARIAESFEAGGFHAHRYIGRIDYPMMEVTRIAIDYLPDSASIEIVRASLFDHRTSKSTALEKIHADSARWRVLHSADDVELVERINPLPRAWLVRRAEAMPAERVLQSIETGKLPDGSAFDPSETVLFALEDFGGREVILPRIGETTGSSVRVTSYGAHRIELDARNPQSAFLVMSEIYYRGWEARLDGQRVPVERVNYALRGLALPPGEHKVEFVFLAHSFRRGALYGALGLLVLGATALAWRRNPMQRHK